MKKTKWVPVFKLFKNDVYYFLRMGRVDWLEEMPQGISYKMMADYYNVIQFNYHLSTTEF